MLITDKSSEDINTFWNDELENSKALLVSVEKAILALTTTLESSGGVQSYTLNTGQDSQTVTRADLPSLYAQRTSLVSWIDQLERRLGLHGGARVIVPAF